MERYAVANIESELFWTAGFFVIAGPSGSGKTTIVKNALIDPRKNIALPANGATLWVLVGGSHDLQNELQPVLNRSVFKNAHFVTEHLSECQALRSAIETNNAGGAHLIFVDDYLSYSTRDSDFIRQMLHRYKRHESLCVVVAVHNLKTDTARTQIVGEMLSFADRVIFPKSHTNINNLSVYLKRINFPLRARPELIKELVADRNAPPEKKRHGIMVHDLKSTYIVADFEALQRGADQRSMYCYGNVYASAHPRQGTNEDLLPQIRSPTRRSSCRSTTSCPRTRSKWWRRRARRPANRGTRSSSAPRRRSRTLRCATRRAPSPSC